MQATIRDLAAQTVEALETLNHWGWTRSQTWTARTQAQADAIQERLTERLERCRWVLRNRYGA